ncbi:MAG: lipopolysaccharide biosynthesis protein [Candidatus Pelethousia sp.]|nr:lipopolysaccharide biosynthesis protein [Candidatus Pelethousia sp.]
MGNLKSISDKRKLLINIAASMSAFVLNVAVGFFISPYIVRTLGVEANGYIQLANNIISYVSIITVAINSMSGRFITIAIATDETDKAVGYYTSVFWANVVLAVLLLLPFIGVIWRLDSLINITAGLVSDVKMLLALAFVNFVLSNLLSLWNNAYYATNTLFLQYARIAIATIVRVVITIILFVSLKPRVFYVTLAALLCVPLTAFWSFRDKERLLPVLKINNEKFSLIKLKEIVSSGIWRSLQATGEILLTGLDLLICNLFISPIAMGVLALSKTVPSMIQQLNWQIASTFAPKLTINFAQERKEEIWNELKHSFKILAVIGTIPLGGLIIFGQDFFRLWVPGEDAGMLQVLSVLSCFWMALLAGVQPVGNVFATVNKVKPQAISVIISGILNTVLVLFAVRFTNLGIYAVAGTSVLIGLLRNLCYTIPASARYLGFAWHKFYIGVWYSAICTAIVMCIGYIARQLIYPAGWKLMFISCSVTAVLAFAVNTLVILSKEERILIFALAKKLIGRLAKR